METSKRFISIRTKFYLLAIIVLIITVSSNIISLYLHSNAIDAYKASIVIQSALSDFFKSNKSINTLFSNYVIEPSSSNLQSFEGELSYAKNILGDIIKNASDNDYKSRFTSLQNMLTTFQENARMTIGFIEPNERRQIFEAAQETIHISSLIDYSYQKYMDLFIQYQTTYADKLLRSVRLNNTISIIIITAGLSVISVFFLFFSNKITRPIILLAKSASEISKNNFDIPQIKLDSNDEINYLSEAFNTMKNNILDYIEKIQEQEKLTQKLLLEENKNLKMENLLKEANIKSLQMQINSHFLFNTLNLISRTAYFEGAPKTVQLIDTTTDYLKYSLNKIKPYVSIFDEIAFAETYIIIQHARFGDRISFDLTVDDDLPDIHVPSLIIQPLVENAIIHGTYDKIGQTEVKVLVTANGKYLKIAVSDNGKGMAPEELENILSLNSDNSEKSSGIGLRNVKDRLDMYLNGKNEIFISSEKGKFFTIEINIALEHLRTTADEQNGKSADAT
jgi:sensor histidine kinase YesM